MSFGQNSGGRNFGTWFLIIGTVVFALKEISEYMKNQRTPKPPPAKLPPPPIIHPPPPTLPDQSIMEILNKISINRSPEQASSLPVYTPPLDEPLAGVVNHPAIVLFVGGRGAGKSAGSVRLQELLRHKGAPYAVGLPASASKLLPSWYGLADDFSAIPENSIIYLPESYRLFHARSSQSSQGRVIGEIVNLSRHRKHTIIFDVQNPAHLDRNILSEVDVVLFKEPGPFQQGFERSQFRSAMDGARAAFSGLGKQQRKKSVWVVAPAAGITGQLMENLLPTFWSDGLSRIFGDSPIGYGPSALQSSNGPKMTHSRKGQRTSVSDRRETAKKMHIAGHSYREIGKTLGCSVSTAYRLVND